MNEKQLADINNALAREAKEAQRGARDASKDIAQVIVRKAVKVCTPAGLAHLFPGLKGKS